MASELMQLLFLSLIGVAREHIARYPDKVLPFGLMLHISYYACHDETYDQFQRNKCRYFDYIVSMVGEKCEKNLDYFKTQAPELSGLFLSYKEVDTLISDCFGQRIKQTDFYNVTDALAFRVQEARHHIRSLNEEELKKAAETMLHFSEFLLSGIFFVIVDFSPGLRATVLHQALFDDPDEALFCYFGHFAYLSASEEDEKSAVVSEYWSKVIKLSEWVWRESNGSL